MQNKKEIKELMDDLIYQYKKYLKNLKYNIFEILWLTYIFET